MSYPYGNYGNRDPYNNPYAYANPYERYQEPVHPVCTLTLAQLLANAEIRKDVVRTLGGGGTGISARWYKVGVELSKLSPYARNKIDSNFLSDITYSENTGPKQASEFLDRLLGLREITGDMFIRACSAALLENVADQLRAVSAQVGTATQSSMDKNIAEFLNSRLMLRADIVRNLANSDGDGQPFWKGVATMLSIQFSRVDGDFISNIEAYHQTTPAQAETFLTNFGQLSGSTLRAFVTACAGTHAKLKFLCDKICNEAGAPEFVKELQFPGAPITIKGKPAAVMQIPSAALANARDEKAEELAASRARILAAEKQMEELKLKNQEMERRLKSAQEPRAGEKPAAAAPASEEDDTCVVCLDQKRTHIVIPCGHVAYCGTCVEVIKKCGLCQAEVQGRYKAFLKN